MSSDVYTPIKGTTSHFPLKQSVSASVGKTGKYVSNEANTAGKTGLIRARERISMAVIEFLRTTLSRAFVNVGSISVRVTISRAGARTAEVRVAVPVQPQSSLIHLTCLRYILFNYRLLPSYNTYHRLSSTLSNYLLIPDSENVKLIVIVCP